MISLAIETAAVEFYRSLGTAEQAGIGIGVTLLLGVVVLGLFPERGERGVAIARRSWIISGAIGTPILLTLFVLLWFARILAGSSVGVVFAVPIVIVAAILLAVGKAIGYVALGGTIATRLGVDNAWVWLPVGALFASVVAVSPGVGLVIELLVLAVGVGAGVRIILGNGSTPEEERTVPPAIEV